MGWSEGSVLASSSVAGSGTLRGPESAAWELEAGVRTRELARVQFPIPLSPPGSPTSRGKQAL